MWSPILTFVNVVSCCQGPKSIRYSYMPVPRTLTSSMLLSENNADFISTPMLSGGYELTTSVLAGMRHPEDILVANTV